jgi:asparagine synthase (glutamine-hydrolysing)
MCGIAGKLNFGDSAVQAWDIKRMLDTIVYRGPDDEGIYTNASVGLGQRRLAIIDLRREATAPLSNEDGTIWIVLNGEIYNFQSLRTELLNQGHSFRTLSDTEVIVHLYEQYGQACLHRLRGMFAFAIWDSDKQVLFAARDRLGKKPLYYTRTPSHFIFGSEIKAITADPSVTASPDFYAIDRYLSCQYVPSPLTAFSGIHKVPAGHYLLCSAQGHLQVESYWHPAGTPKTTLCQEDAQEQLLAILKESIRLRMTADVPVGAFLSGGIDSGAVVALMAMQSDKPVKTFSIGFNESRYNELPFARILAKHYGTEHHEFMVSPSAIEILPRLIRHYNEPFADASAIPTFYLAQFTRQYVTVALSGDGGDESFAGYHHYLRMQQLALFDRVPQPLRAEGTKVLRFPLRCFPGSEPAMKLDKALGMMGATLPQRYHQYLGILKDQEKDRLYTSKFHDLIRSSHTNQNTWEIPWASTTDQLDWMMAHDQTHYLPDGLMVKTDIASMANSLEVRCPLLDHDLVEFAWSLSSQWKMNAQGQKVIFKNAVRSLLPQEILQKPKTGFGVPLAQWFRTELSGLLKDTLLSKQAIARGLFNPSFLRQMVDDQLAERRDWANRLWALICLEMWFREFID